MNVEQILQAIQHTSTRNREILGLKLVFEVTKLHPNVQDECLNCGVSWPCPTVMSVQEVLDAS
jgi:hypothetical protein